jgi:uncharacterized membrane protein YoaK (UPF0700 family)
MDKAWFWPSRQETSAADTDQALTVLLIVLTFGTGVVDAASYVGLHNVFTANMTGNVIFIGLGLAGHAGTPLGRSLVALVGFALGALLAGRYLRPAVTGVRVPGRVVHLLGTVAVVFATLTVASAFWVPGQVGLDIATALFSIAMGMQAGAARRIAVAEVSTVVVTSTFASLFADSRLGGGSRTRQARRLGAILAMCGGACVGALLLHLSIWVPLALATLVAGAVTYHLNRWAARENRPQRGGPAIPSARLADVATSQPTTTRDGR